MAGTFSFEAFLAGAQSVANANTNSAIKLLGRFAPPSAPEIVSEQNDISKIDWRAARGDIVEMAKMGGGNVVVAAQRRANLDTSNGRVNMFAAGQAPWHKLGVLIREATDSAHGLALAGQDWTQELVPAQIRGKDVPNQFHIQRTDTGTVLSRSTVTAKYSLIQNVDGWKAVDNILKEFGARYETAGSLDEGRMVWALAKMPSQSFTINGVDRTESYLLFTTSNDGSGAAMIFPTTERVVCANTLRVSIAGRKSGISIRHTGDTKAKIRAAEHAIRISAKSFDTYREAATAMASYSLKDSRPYVNGVLDMIAPVSLADMARGGFEGYQFATGAEKEKMYDTYTRGVKERSKMFDDVYSRLSTDRNTLGGMGGTLWQPFNALTESADYGVIGGRRIGSDVKKEETRFASVIEGKADTAKQIALRNAMALMA